MGVFLSYASEDAGAAKRICDALRVAAIEVWFDQSELRGGDAWDQKIRQQIRDCALFVPIISAHTQARPEGYFRLEWKLAVDRSHLMAAEKAFLVPVVVDATTEPEALVPAQFREVQWTRFQDDQVQAAFVDRIATLLSQRVAAHVGSPERGVGRARPRRPPIVLIALSVAAVVALVIATAIGGGWLSHKLVPKAEESTASASVATTPAAIPEKSVAVLPFADMSEKKDQEYFADGMAEEVINLLAKVPDLRIQARTSSFYFKGKATKIPDIARDLGVAHVLEGSVRRSGNHLRVTAQLIRADNGYHLWSETYDRDVHDVFKVQDDLANAVVQALQITLMGGPLTRQKGGTENLEAYQLYLRGGGDTLLDSTASLEAAQSNLERAVKLDPDFALGWARLSFITCMLAVNRALPTTMGFERSRELAQHALRLSPHLTKAHFVLGYIHRTYDWDWAAAQEEASRALTSDPTDPEALRIAGMIAATLGHWDDAEGRLRAALVRDPLDTYGHWNLATTLYRAGRFADADATYRRLIELAPTFAWAHAYLARTLLVEGKRDEALSMAQQEVEEADRADVLPMVFQALGRRAEADEALKALITKFADTDAYSVAMNYAYQDDHERAFQWLDRAYKQKEIKFVEIVGEHMFKNLADDPRYKALLRKLNLPES
jgi:TolB-like protein/Tfp pilus assembly protein PilF